ncbi:putative ribonuclease H-like domain-containing protein [Tanacetum coccineum]
MGENDQATRNEFERLLQQEKQTVHPNSTNSINTISTPVSVAGPSFTNDDPSSPVNVAEASNAFEEHLVERFSTFKNAFTLPPISNVTLMDDIRIFGNAYDDEDVAEENKSQRLSELLIFLFSLLNGTQESDSSSRRSKLDRSNARGASTISTLEVRNKARLVAQGYTQEEGIDYDEVFAPVARIEAIRLFLAYASFMGFIVYQMDVKSALLKIGNYDGEKKDGIFISQDKYVADILKKFDFATVKTASTPMEPNKALVKDEEADSVDVHLYRSMIGSLMYLTASRPDIMFAVCACARFQVTPKMSHLHAVKRIFRYLKGQPKLGLWYPRDSPFDLEAFSDSDYARASLDRKSTTGGCQFLGKRLISWQCKKRYSCKFYLAESRVLWIQNQMLDYGFNFMNTKIYIDNESTICIVKNPVFHSKTKHIEIRHHFIRDSYEKKLIQVIKIHTDHNVADLLTKAFDVSRLDERECIIKQKWVKDETVYKEWEDRMERAATTASSLEAEQDSGSGPRCQDTILGGAKAQSRFEATSKQSNDPPLSRVNTLGSGEDSMKLMELMEHCTTLSELVSLKE